MRNLLLPLAILLTPSIAMADFGLKWDHPAKRADGSALPLSEIDHTVVSWECSFRSDSKKVPAPATTTEVDPPTPGNKCTFTAITVDKAGLRSQPSKAFEYITPTSPPAPPSWVAEILEWIRKTYGL